MFRFPLTGQAAVTTVRPCTGEAADDLMKRALLRSGCIISEEVMIPLRAGWLHTFTFRRPRLGWSKLGYGPTLHMQISAINGVGGTVYSSSCGQQDGKGSFKFRKYETLDEVLRSL